ncbi:hypothetical protein [Halorientalis regularis]|jgi:hypothetical protein|uniref:hypothetical protein n=1 Tax=Halorientalis regularis TaxID=660518 RepID=UPI001113B7E5|nr:hypothetical protein [Halorientalis regularis]
MTPTEWDGVTTAVALGVRVDDTAIPRILEDVDVCVPDTRSVAHGPAERGRSDLFLRSLDRRGRSVGPVESPELVFDHRTEKCPGHEFGCLDVDVDELVGPQLLPDLEDEFAHLEDGRSLRNN